MRYLPVSQLKEGMMLGQELQDASGTMLLERHTRLTKENISYISFLEVAGIYIEDDFSRDVEIKEIVYQAVAYMGIGRVFPFLKVTNEVFEAQGIELPLEGQSTTTTENRREAGTQAQVDIFGEGMRDFWKSGDDESRHINLWLADNCFGDYYTRMGLDYRQREMITFCFLAAQGGCEPQLTAHAAGNMKVGNDKPFLIAVISQCLPYIGYPRSLNALRCVNDAAEQFEKN